MKSKSDKLRLSHIDRAGDLRMVDVSAKDVTVREATASARIQIQSEIIDQLLAGELPKGEALAAARIAGVQAAKRTSELIPLCHPLALDWVRIEINRVGDSLLEITCSAKTSARTGVEMEALTGAAVAALTLYDMAKSADKAIAIGPIQLERKTGGKSGPYRRAKAR